MLRPSIIAFIAALVVAINAQASKPTQFSQLLALTKGVSEESLVEQAAQREAKALDDPEVDSANEIENEITEKGESGKGKPYLFGATRRSSFFSLPRHPTTSSLGFPMVMNFKQNFKTNVDWMNLGTQSRRAKRSTLDHLVPHHGHHATGHVLPLPHDRPPHHAPLFPPIHPSPTPHAPHHEPFTPQIVPLPHHGPTLMPLHDPHVPVHHEHAPHVPVHHEIPHHAPVHIDPHHTPLHMTTTLFSHMAPHMHP